MDNRAKFSTRKMVWFELMISRRDEIQPPPRLVFVLRSGLRISFGAMQIQTLRVYETHRLKNFQTPVAGEAPAGTALHERSVELEVTSYAPRNHLRLLLWLFALKS